MFARLFVHWLFLLLLMMVLMVLLLLLPFVPMSTFLQIAVAKHNESTRAHRWVIGYGTLRMSLPGLLLLSSVLFHSRAETVLVAHTV